MRNIYHYVDSGLMDDIASHDISSAKTCLIFLGAIDALNGLIMFIIKLFIIFALFFGTIILSQQANAKTPEHYTSYCKTKNISVTELAACHERETEFIYIFGRRPATDSEITDVYQTDNLFDNENIIEEKYTLKPKTKLIEKL